MKKYCLKISQTQETHKSTNPRISKTSSRIRTEKPKSQHNIVKMKTIRKNENIKKTANKKQKNQIAFNKQQLGPIVISSTTEARSQQTGIFNGLRDYDETKIYSKKNTVSEKKHVFPLAVSHKRNMILTEKSRCKEIKTCLNLFHKQENYHRWVA